MESTVSVQCYRWRLALRDLAFKAENRAVSWGQWLSSRVFEWQEAAPPRVVPGEGCDVAEAWFVFPCARWPWAGHPSHIVGVTCQRVAGPGLP